MIHTKARGEAHDIDILPVQQRELCSGVKVGLVSVVLSLMNDGHDSRSRYLVLWGVWKWKLIAVFMTLL